MIDDCVRVGEHAAQYAIIGSLSQARSFDNRDCENRKVAGNCGMSDKRPTQPEGREIFRRLESAGLKQRELAEALGIEENKVTKVKNGERRFTGGEIMNAFGWLARKEAERGGVSLRAYGSEMPSEEALTGMFAGLLASVRKIEDPRVAAEELAKSFLDAYPAIRRMSSTEHQQD